MTLQTSQKEQRPVPTQQIPTTPDEVRQACRSGKWTTQTSGLVPGFAQANLVILPRDDAADFRQFCERVRLCALPVCFERFGDVCRIVKVREVFLYELLDQFSFSQEAWRPEEAAAAGTSAFQGDWVRVQLGPTFAHSLPEPPIIHR